MFAQHNTHRFPALKSSRREPRDAAEEFFGAEPPNLSFPGTYCFARPPLRRHRSLEMKFPSPAEPNLDICRSGCDNPA